MKATSSETKSRIDRLIFVFVMNAIVFVVFDLGHIAASGINKVYSTGGFTNDGVYFFVLGILFSSLVLCLVVEKIAKVVFWKTAVYFAFVSLLMALCLFVSIVPSFDRIAPFWFNAIFSLLYTAIIGAPDLICLVKRSKS